ncbi:MAG: glycosyltransferase family 4 protein [Acidobacteriia bacterium]|nr:glycosyltransferase family 4 protein [Terriglobia bacterium]
MYDASTHVLLGTAMRIGFDARAAFLDPHRGFGRVARALAGALLDAVPGEVVLFVSHGARVPHSWYSRAASVVQLSRPRRGAFLFDPIAWQVTLRRHRLDVLHLPTWGVPRGVPIPTVATFYDATPFRFTSPPQRWKRWRARMTIRSLVRATVIHAISEHARDELLGVTPVRGEKVSVVHLGVDATFSPAPTPERPRHLLFVGGADPHKNLDLLIGALSDPAARALPPLVIAGPTRVSRSGRAMASKAVTKVVSNPTDSELVDLYRGALALLLPSRNEGFGLPALEAMACGCPVIAANTGALPEVCGDAAMLLDPDDRAAWRDAITTLATDAHRVDILRKAGLARARSFTWERTAGSMLDLYRRAVRRESS